MRTEIGNIEFTHLVDKKDANTRIRVHCHDKYEILYVLEGSGECIVEGVKHRISPRTLMVIPPLAYHCIEINAGEAYDRYIVNFSADDLSSDVRHMLALFDVDNSDDGYFYTKALQNRDIDTHLSRFEQAIELTQEESVLYYKMLLSQIILFISLSKKQTVYRNESELGARVIRYLNEFVTKNISLDHLAKHFFVSKYYLCRAFKKYNGISVHGYINHKRIMYAKQLIDSGETASSAAYRVGFGDYSAFYRAYVKVVGKAPTAQEGENRA